ncbi:MAG: serine hydrolase, partial [Streptococcus sp.]
MKKYFNLRSIMIAVSILLCLVGTSALGYLHLTQPTASAIEKKAKKTKEAKEQDIEKSTPETKKPRVKSPEAKQAVVDADMETMSAYGLVYDYANKGLVEVVQDFLAESGIDPSQVAFTYRNAITGEQFAMNDLQPMTAGSTYKLPLNMLVVDEVTKGKLNLTDRFDINNTYYEYVGEHDNYVAAFDGAMSIPDMQRYSLVYSENTPAYA